MLAALFVRRPVLAVVINALILVAGLAALLGVEIRELPSVEQPVLSISTSFTGAAAETVDREITAKIEGAVARVQGVASISSRSSNGNSRVTLAFNDGTNLDTATSDVRDALSRTGRNLPDGADDPVIFKADADAQAAIRLAVTSDTLSIAEMSDLVDNVVAERLAAVEGVADVQIYGTKETAFEVDIDQAKLASLGLSVVDVRNALSTMAFDAPAGSINAANQNILVRAVADVNTPAEFENLAIKGNTRLGDVASVVFDAAASNISLRSDGRQGIGLGIVRQAQSNMIEISRGVEAAVATLNEILPEGVNVKISSDESVFIDGALHEVEVALGVALLVVAGIIYLFLLDWRATLIPALSMPIALLGAVAGIYLAGFSLNILTLLALVLATGLVVDDAIVVLENIVRRRSLGAGNRAAAVLGTQEVFFAVIATTLTLVAVFVPLSFLSGQTGRLFREFGFTLAMAVLVSSVVALTLGPMLASRLLKPSDDTKHHGGPLGHIGRALGKLYRATLHQALNNPLVVLLVALLFAGASYLVFTQLRQEITPREDRAQINVRVSAPSTVSLDFVRSQMQRLEDLLQPFVKSGEVESIFVISGFGNGGFLGLRLAPWDERRRSQADIVADVNKLLPLVPGVRASLFQGNSLGIRGGGSGLQFAVVGDNYSRLAETAHEIAAKLEQNPAFGNLDVNYDTTQPQLTLTIDRARAAALGIDINGLATTMQAMIDGADIGNVFINDTSYTVRMVSTKNPVNDPHDLESLFIKTGDGRYVPMSTIASIVEAPIAPTLGREEQRRAVTVTASLDGLALGDAYQQALEIARPLLPEGMAIIPLAEAKTIGEANNGLLITFGFAIIIILLVLAAQFESLWSAIIVMVTVPFGVAAAIYALFLTGGSLNIYSQIGLVLVVGIMAKNGILIVEFANQLRDRGMAVREAVEEAANIRLRPVMMTMIATILGGVPLVLASGAGAEARQALGWVIVGGLSIAAISTLYLTPVAYLLLARFAKPRIEEENRLRTELDAVNEAAVGAAE
ncbi:efflux RND transporter permease subunit [Devosia algicola]|uniref:Efflux RND transporter permease subunit n=1 Tax=Devosia algicola TaxID=3026418 RepID=A0ABY7YS53_9HYPH|nr:efflux RND transporter permease subunit [Devosia algicola]WDR03895.1 efflux RND transporter permease subunit [Devosia algicola]